MERRVGQYILGDTIGKGGFAVVYKGLDTVSGAVVAVKVMKITSRDEAELESLREEVRLLELLSHPNIVRIVDSNISGSSLYIVLEYLEGGSLSSIMKKFGGKLEETLVTRFVVQLLRGVDYIHGQGLLHRDLKGANLLLDKNGVLRVADFGVAAKVSAVEDDFSAVGTPYWMAPEIIEMSGPSPACDIWSVGATVIELLTGAPPYFSLSPMTALFRIVQDDHPPMPEGISPACRDFLFRCFKKEPELRWTAAQLLEHPWIKQAMESRPSLYEGLPGADPSSGAAGDGSGAAGAAGAAGGDGGAAGGEEKSAAGEGGFGDGSDEEEEDWDAEFADDDDDDGLFEASSDKRAVIQAQMRALRGKRSSDAGVPASGPLLEGLGDDDIDDMFWDDDEDGAFGKRVAEAVADASRTRELTLRVPADMLTKGNNARLSRFKESEEDEDYEDFDFGDDGDLDMTAFADGDAPGFSGSASGSGGVAAAGGDDDDGDDVAGLDLGGIELKLKRREADDADDAFADLLFDDFDDDAFEEDRNKELLNKKSLEALRLMHGVSPSERDDAVVLRACQSLLSLFRTVDGLREQFVKDHGVLPIMEMLEVTRPAMLHAVLCLVNELLAGDRKLMENLSLVGMIPIVTRFSSRLFSKRIRLQAAAFVLQLCHTSVLTMQMFIACGGLPVLAGLLEPNYAEDGDLSRYAIDGISHVFTLSTIPKNDFCRLFVKAGTLKRLATVMRGLTGDAARESALPYAGKVANLLLLFSRNVGDPVVNRALARKSVLRMLAIVLTREAGKADSEALQVTMLKVVKNLTMEPGLLHALEEAGMIAAVMRYLSSREGVHASAMHNHALQALYYLCRINRRRQEAAAREGIIVHLQHVIRSGSAMKQMAHQMLCDLAHASRLARDALWRADGVTFYLAMLKTPYWQVHALRALAVWLADDLSRVESLLLSADGLHQMITLFQTAQSTTFESLLEPVLDMMSRSVNLNQALGRSALFVTELVERVRYPKAIVRYNLLKMLKAVYEHHTAPKALILDFNLYPTVHELAKEATMVLVSELASQLVAAFRLNVLV